MPEPTPLRPTRTKARGRHGCRSGRPPVEDLRALSRNRHVGVIALQPLAPTVPFMRFTIVTETYPPEVNGVANTVAGFERGLRELGHEVNVVRPRQPGKGAARANHLEVAGAALPRYQGLRFGLPATRRLAQQWRTQRPDAIYVATEGPLGWSALRAARGLGIPAATGFHTRFDHYAERYGAAWLAPAAFAWMRRLHNQGGVTIAPTRELAGFLRSRGFHRVEVVGRAVDTQLFHPSRRDDALRERWGAGNGELVVIHLGRIAPEKNLDLAVRAFRAIERRTPGAKFVFTGDGPSRKALQAANPDFIFTGAKQDTELAAHFASADLFLFPSLTETFGNVTLESMASGVPLVAYDYGAAREHAHDGESAACIAPGDEAAFIDAAVLLGTHPSLRAHYRQSALAGIAQLSPHSVQQAFADVLCRLASGAESQGLFVAERGA